MYDVFYHHWIGLFFCGLTFIIWANHTEAKPAINRLLDNLSFEVSKFFIKFFDSVSVFFLINRYGKRFFTWLSINYCGRCIFTNIGYANTRLGVFLMPFQDSHRTAWFLLNGNRILVLKVLVFSCKSCTNSAISRLPALTGTILQYYQQIC